MLLLSGVLRTDIAEICWRIRVLGQGFDVAATMPPNNAISGLQACMVESKTRKKIYQTVKVSIIRNAILPYALDTQ